MLTYTLFLLKGGTVSEELFQNITLLVLVMTPLFAMIALLIQFGHYSWPLKYLNTFLQVTLVSGAILFDTLAEGPLYAMSSMPPMAYALVAAVTAFRLQPLLGLFAGAVASVEFLLLYLLVMQPTPEMIQAVPSLSLPVTLMKVIILFALGVVCAFAARRLQNFLVGSVEDAVRTTMFEKTFGRYLSKEVALHVMQDGEVEPQMKEAVIVFGDIRGFTNFSTTQTPVNVAMLLNAFFEVVCRIVEEEGGMVNKFLGDGYLALFGIFGDSNEAANSAARAVTRIQKESKVILSIHNLSAGAAANIGDVITGELGSEGRCEFTAIGAPVNLASRLEGMNSQLGTDFLASQSFVDAIHDSDYRIESKGKHTMKGFDEPLDVYAIEPSTGS